MRFLNIERRLERIEKALSISESGKENNLEKELLLKALETNNLKMKSQFFMEAVKVGKLLRSRLPLSKKAALPVPTQEEVAAFMHEVRKEIII